MSVSTTLDQLEQDIRAADENELLSFELDIEMLIELSLACREQKAKNLSNI